MTKQDVKAIERVVQFGAFEVCLGTGELRKHGIRVRLQTQPFQILKALLEQPGHVVTREDLRRRLWPGDTFGDFESGLNTAINRLRLTLGDSAEEPRYVETVSRIGYRFVAPISEITVDRPELPTAAFDPPPRVLPHAGLDLRASTDARPSRVARNVPLFVGALALAGVCSALYLLRSVPRENTAAPVYHQITFRRGIVNSARFAPSGEIVYAAAWGTEDPRLYMVDVNSPESRDLEFGAARLAAVSRFDELAIFRSPEESSAARELSTVPLHGGSPRAFATEVVGADWAADGKTLALVRQGDSGLVLEFPPGKVLYRSPGWLESARISPSGDQIAFIEHPIEADDGGSIICVDSSGRVHRLSENWASVRGLAWHPSGKEIWFAAAKQGVNREIHAVSLDGHLRTVASLAAVLELFDIAPSGRVLIGRATARLDMFTGSMATLAQKDISWFDWSHVTAISADGNNVLFDESGEGGGPDYSVYLYHRKAGATERIAEGRALDLSRDGRWVITASRTDLSRISLISTSDAQRRTFTSPGLAYQSARFLPSGNSIVVLANSNGGSAQTYVQDLNSGEMHLVKNGKGLYNAVLSPDGSSIAAAQFGRKEVAVLHLSSGERQSVVVKPGGVPVVWAGDDSLVIATGDGHSIRLDTVDIRTGKTTPFRRLPLEALVTEKTPLHFHVSADLTTFAYSQLQKSTHLFAVDGWK